MNEASVRPARAVLPSAIVVVLVVATLAAMHLPYPLTEDQAAFTYGARELAEGARMYREFWDIKQPGIYWWFTASGLLFGFDAWGARWMDLCWSLAVALVLWAAVRERGLLAAVLAPCLCFGAFYAKATQFHLSQVEWLVGGPVAVLLWCVGGQARTARQLFWRYVLAGAMATAVGIFKTMAALVPVAMLLVAIAHSHWHHGRGWGELLKQQVLAALLGVLLVIAPLALWMLLDGTLSGALWTAFVYPPQALHEYQHQTLQRLLWAFHWFRRGNIWLVPWALWAVYIGLRRGGRLELLCIAWGASAVVVICMQVLSYWEYHFDLLFMPLGVLAALGFADLLDRLAARRLPVLRGAAVALMLACVLAALGPGLVHKAVRLAQHMPFTLAQQRAFLELLDDRIAVLEASARAVNGLIPPTERVIVWGDPRLYFLLDRRPVLQVNGSAIYLAQQMESIAALIRRQPPPLIYLSKERDRLLYHGGGVVPNTVSELYELYYEDRLGAWYRLRRKSMG